MGNCGSAPEVKESGVAGQAAQAAPEKHVAGAAAKYAVPPSEHVASPKEAPSTEKAASANNIRSSAERAVPSGKNSDALPINEALMKVSLLLQKFAEGRSERTAPVTALKRALELAATDCKAKFASVQSVSEAGDGTLVVAMVGAPDLWIESHRLQVLKKGGSLATEKLIDEDIKYLSLSHSKDKSNMPVDWEMLAREAGLENITAVPIVIGDKIIGVLTFGFDVAVDPKDENNWRTYMSLVASSIGFMIKDTSVPKYLALAQEINAAPDLDSLMHSMISRMRVMLGHSNNQHIWYRVALTSSTNAAATIFDDFNEVPAAAMGQKTASSSSSSINSSGSFRLLREVQQQGGIMRTVVATKSTIMKISVHHRQQVMIPDVQKLMNQSGSVSTDIFNTRLIKPPTSLLIFPLKIKQTVFGCMFCMSAVNTDFSDVSPKLRELSEVISPLLLSVLNRAQQVEYNVIQSTTPQDMDSLNMSFGGGVGSSGIGIAGSQSDAFVFSQSRSSTGALVTGLTEKLNQKRLKSSMQFDGNKALLDLQVNSMVGEGGFAKVFRGVWRGLMVGVKVVVDDGKNEKNVLKNAHEIAILSTISHPNIVQAYTCMTDILVRDLCMVSFRTSGKEVTSSKAFQYLQSMEDRRCHVELIEFCDLGNLLTAVNNGVFHLEEPSKMLSNPEAYANSTGADPDAPKGSLNMKCLILTLIEVASAMGDLHRMGVVHCDLKPANVLLKSSNGDPRGFTAKVSDFGLSRIEDDESSSSFPFNSCGTAAYVAPEALISNKKVNSKVDVYSYGIMMWEIYTGLRPYQGMQQQHIVEEVVIRGLRPKFPANTPSSYAQLAHACWGGNAQARPTFEEVLSFLNQML